MFDFFSAKRPSTLASQAMIATSHPLSTAAGLEILSAGGSAVDAALAAVAVQCVVDPLMTGIGGDCFALYAPKDGPIKALNGSGRAPAAATVAALKEAGLGDEIPQTSPHSVTIPGAISAWCLLHADHGTMPLERLFARAIGYAENHKPNTTPDSRCHTPWNWNTPSGSHAGLSVRPSSHVDPAMAAMPRLRPSMAAATVPE